MNRFHSPLDNVRVVAWSWQTRTGLDVAAVMRGPSRVLIEGRVQVQWEDGPLELAYRLECGPEWGFVRLDARTSHQGRTQALELRLEDGLWMDGHGPRDDLGAAAYIDIMATPITNSLPLCHATWEPGASKTFTMAYIRLPELVVEPVSQRYTYLGEGPEGTRRFRYETLGPTGDGSGTSSPSGRGVSGYHGQDATFTAELVADADGLVIEYPPYWRRMPAAQALMAGYS